MKLVTQAILAVASCHNATLDDAGRSPHTAPGYSPASAAYFRSRGFKIEDSEIEVDSELAGRGAPTTSSLWTRDPVGDKYVVRFQLDGFTSEKHYHRIRDSLRDMAAKTCIDFQVALEIYMIIYMIKYTL